MVWVTVFTWEQTGSECSDQMEGSLRGPHLELTTSVTEACEQEYLQQESNTSSLLGGSVEWGQRSAEAGDTEIQERITVNISVSVCVCSAKHISGTTRAEASLNLQHRNNRQK